MRRAEELESQVGELEGELRSLLDEYVEVQQRLQTLEAVTGRDGERVAEDVLADLPGRLQRVAAATADAEPSVSDADEAAREAVTGCASQAEVAAAVERVEESDESGESTPGANTEAEDDGLDDIIIG